MQNEGMQPSLGVMDGFPGKLMPELSFKGSQEKTRGKTGKCTRQREQHVQRLRSKNLVHWGNLAGICSVIKERSKLRLE